MKTELNSLSSGLSEHFQDEFISEVIEGRESLVSSCLRHPLSDSFYPVLKLLALTDCLNGISSPLYLCQCSKVKYLDINS